MVRDVSCKKCDAKLGWMYVSMSQHYKSVICIPSQLIHVIQCDSSILFISK